MKERLYRIVFEADSRAGRLFDVILLWLIVISVVLVFLDSVPEYNKNYRQFFIISEWTITIFFTLEYILRIVISARPLKYVFSFWGFVDLLAILPTYLSLVLVNSHYLLVIRIFRLLRVFRVLKLVRFIKESEILFSALKASTHKIGVFLLTVTSVVVTMGTIMYVVEGGKNGFESIPHSIYWAVVTVTTVGYGDIIPQTPLGKFVSSIAMIIGFAIIAVPTGIITVEMTKASAAKVVCRSCAHNNTTDAKYCNQCGTMIT